MNVNMSFVSKKGARSIFKMIEESWNGDGGACCVVSNSLVHVYALSLSNISLLRFALPQ
jgi:hypothetical protein